MIDVMESLFKSSLSSPPRPSFVAQLGPLDLDQYGDLIGLTYLKLATNKITKIYRAPHYIDAYIFTISSCREVRLETLEYGHIGNPHHPSSIPESIFQKKTFKLEQWTLNAE